MEFEYYFNPVEFKKVNNWLPLPKWAIGNAIEKNTNEFAGNFTDVDVALIGVEEDRNASQFEKGADPDRVRSMLYQLNSIDKDLRIVDLGNLKLGNKITDTYFCLNEIVSTLLSHGVRPVIIGGTQDIVVPLENLIGAKYNGNFLVVDSRIDFEFDYELYDADHFLNGFSNATLSKTSIIGYQNYFVDEETRSRLSEKGVAFQRIGEVKNNLQEIEPLLRDSRIISIDTKCIKSGEFNGNFFPSPNGFTAQELCQMTWYMGNSNLTNALVFSGYTGTNDENGNDAMLLAQAVWHFALGVNQKNNDFCPQDQGEMQHFDIEFQDFDYTLLFVQNRQSQRWWVSVVNEKMEQGEFVACSALDYEQACQNVLTGRVAELIQLS